MPERLTKASQRETTIENLIGVARQLFSQRGYAQTSTEDIVRAASVTRGALYHHFKNKADLFRAVLERVQIEIAERIESAAQLTNDPKAQLQLGCRAFLQVSLEPDVQRIALIDAPAVVGWQVWRELDAEHAVQSLKSSLRALEVTPLEATAHLLSGAMNEAVLWIAGSNDPTRALEEADAVLQGLLETIIAGRAQ